MKLEYSSTAYREILSTPLRTLQLFITNRCNLRCKGCFYAAHLGREDMKLGQYTGIVTHHAAVSGIQRITLLGGEPTLHPDLSSMVEINDMLGLKTTVYTNGNCLDKTCELPAQIRVGVHGLYSSEKPLSALQITPKKFTLVYMLDASNVEELQHVPLYVSRYYPQVDEFYLSSIRDITVSGSFWVDTEDTISNDKYAEIVQNFIGRDDVLAQFRRIHISTRGVIKTAQQTFDTCTTCRFGNIYPDGKQTICPMDIGKGIEDPKLFTGRRCNKSSACVLQKIVLERVIS